MDDEIPIIRGTPTPSLPAKDVVDIVHKIVTTIAILTAGAWALYTFVIQRTGVWNVALTVTPQIIQYSNTQKLLTVDVALKNVGKVRAKPSGKDGCLLSVRRLAGDAKAQNVLAADMRTGTLLRWQDAGESVVTDVDMLRHYDPGTYELEPGVEYHELEAVVLPEGSLFLVKVSFSAGTNDNDVITEYRLVSTQQLTSEAPNQALQRTGAAVTPAAPTSPPPSPTEPSSGRASGTGR